MQYIEAANHFNGRNGYSPRFLIMHGTAGGSSAVGVANYFAGQPQNDSGSSASYVNDREGIVVQCVQDTDAPWANGPITQGHDPFWDNINCDNPNYVTIAIENVKPSTDNSDALTEAQYQSLLSLSKALCKKYGIPKRWADSHGGITGHYSLDPVNRSRCPGPFPWDRFFADLNKTNTEGGSTDLLQLTDPMGKDFVQSGTCQWYCPSKKVHINGAMLVYYQMTQGALGLPEAEEQYNIKGVVWQRFERGFLVYDPQNLLKNTPPSAHNSTYMAMLSSSVVQDALTTPLRNEVKTAQTATTAAQKALADSQAQVLLLGKEVSELKAGKPVDVDRVSKDITNLQSTVADMLLAIKPQ